MDASAIHSYLATHIHASFRVICVAFACLAVVAGASAQSPSSTEYHLAADIECPSLDRPTRARIDQLDAFVADQRYDEAVPLVRELLESPSEGLIAVSPTRRLGVREYLRIRMAAYPGPMLNAYREQVDRAAELLLKESLEQRDAQRLARIVRDYPLSRSADEAIDALAQIALERGEYDVARTYWEMLIATEAADATPAAWFAYPDADLAPAVVRSRLVLVSILEGDLSRATRELDAFSQQHPGEQGVLAGETCVLAEKLAELLHASETWRDDVSSSPWHTFAGHIERQWTAAMPLAVRAPAWRADLPVGPGPSSEIWSSDELRRFHASAVAEDGDAPLAYHPIIWNGLVLANTPTEILAFDAATGRPAWDAASPVIYRDPSEFLATAEQSGKKRPDWSRIHPGDSLLPARCTLTVHGDRLVARMGPTATGFPDNTDFRRVRPGRIVCLDLAAQGRLLWSIEPDDPRFAFDGTPLIDESGVYVAMRRSDIMPRAHVACFDPNTGERRWRTFIAAGPTPEGGRLHQTTHDLLTRHGQRLFYNTHLGAVAAIGVDTGEIAWLNEYSRTRRGSLQTPSPAMHRGLSPCVYHGGRIYAAPRDSDRIYCFNASDGRMLWQSDAHTEDVVHLLGVEGGYLIASGRRLHFIHSGGPDAGRTAYSYPANEREHLGYGRGLTAGGLVYWPTRKRLLVFDVNTLRLVREHPLSQWGVSGGNLASDGERLIIAGPRGMTLAPVE